MRNRLELLFLFLLIPIIVPAVAAGEEKRFTGEIEFSPVWQTRNDVRIPSSTGTDFSLRDIQGSGPFATGRFNIYYAFNPKHELGILVAPLLIKSTGELHSPVFFAGESFAPGTGISATYRFNSYRLTYRYRFYNGDRWTWKIGITGKIRDAKIELSDGVASAEDTDLGFVPLLHLDGEYRFAPQWKLHLNMDGLAAPQGRAFDISLKIKRDISKNWTLAGGYRVLEGGADVERVYTFAWLHYVTASISFRF